jgi:hypothetical protein
MLSQRDLGEQTAFATLQIAANASFNLSFTVRRRRMNGFCFFLEIGPSYSTGPALMAEGVGG